MKRQIGVTTYINCCCHDHTNNKYHTTERKPAVWWHQARLETHRYCTQSRIQMDMWGPNQVLVWLPRYQKNISAGKYSNLFFLMWWIENILINLNFKVFWARRGSSCTSQISQHGFHLAFSNNRAVLLISCHTEICIWWLKEQIYRKNLIRNFKLHHAPIIHNW